MQWYYYSRERLINLHRLWSCHRLLVGHICSLISGAHIYYEHIMMCIKNIWFAWTSSQRYQSAIINQLGNIWERQRWWDDERNCGSTHTWYVHMYTTIPLQLMMMMRELLVEKFNNQPSLSAVHRTMYYTVWVMKYWVIAMGIQSVT